MKKLLSAGLALAASFAFYAPAHAACDKEGHIMSIKINPNGAATFQLRPTSVTSVQVFHYSVNDEKVFDAALAAVPPRARVKVHAAPTAVCSTGVGAPPAATHIFVTP